MIPVLNFVIFVITIYSDKLDKELGIHRNSPNGRLRMFFGVAIILIDGGIAPLDRTGGVEAGD